MSNATNKKKYFEDAKEAQRTFERIFCGIKSPIMQIYESIRNIFPSYSVSLASEFQNDYSPFIIQIHEKGKSVPIHKDNVRYEGKEYALSDIDCQLSCVLHLQESENGEIWSCTTNNGKKRMKDFEILTLDIHQK